MSGNLKTQKICPENCYLIVMVGLPYSGKSTAAKELGFPMVNPDSIRVALHGQRFSAEAEPHVWAIAKTMVRSLFLAGHKTVILDATNTTVKRRSEWISKEWSVEFMEIDTDPLVCVERARKAGDKVILPVIEKMFNQYEPLMVEELG